MRLPGLLLLLFSFALAASACSRPGEKRCAQVCEHYLELYLNDKYAEPLKNAADQQARAAVEADRNAEYKERRENEEYGFEACINRCNRRSRGTVSDCVMAAETLQAAKKCDADEACSIATGNGRNSFGGLLVMLVAVGSLLGWRRRRRD